MDVDLENIAVRLKNIEDTLRGSREEIENLNDAIRAVVIVISIAVADWQGASAEFDKQMRIAKQGRPSRKLGAGV